MAVSDHARLLPKQKSMRFFTYLLWLGCEITSLLLRRKKLSARENTQRSYRDLFDPLCADTGVWPDYTEGYFENGDESYEESKIKQFDFILDATHAKSGTRLLDIGCGNGGLLSRAVERGCVVQGITVAETQVEACRRQGLDVIQASFEELRERFEPASFDVIILNGPTEHFVTETDALEGRTEAIRQGLFDDLSYLLKANGRVFISCIHFRQPTDIKQVVKHPLLHRFGSYYFYCSILNRIYSGWYPFEGDYEKHAAQAGLKLVFERDATQDYLLTSRCWSKRLKAFINKNPAFMKRFYWRFFWKDPRYFFITFLFYYYHVWIWQFRGNPSPMKHLWLVFDVVKSENET